MVVLRQDRESNPRTPANLRCTRRAAVLSVAVARERWRSVAPRCFPMSNTPAKTFDAVHMVRAIRDDPTLRRLMEVARQRGAADAASRRA